MEITLGKITENNTGPLQRARRPGRAPPCWLRSLTTTRSLLLRLAKLGRDRAFRGRPGGLFGPWQQSRLASV